MEVYKGMLHSDMPRGPAFAFSCPTMNTCTSEVTGSCQEKPGRGFFCVFLTYLQADVAPVYFEIQLVIHEQLSFSSCVTQNCL